MLDAHAPPLVHYFIKYSKDADKTPFADGLREANLHFKLVTGDVRLRYRHRSWLYFVGWPRVILFAIVNGYRSLTTRPRPEYIVVGTHFEIFFIDVIRRLLFLRDTKLVLYGFILTTRKQKIVNDLRTLYFGYIFSRCHKVVAFSMYEVNKYKRMFPRQTDKFVCVHYGIGVNNRTLLTDSELPSTYVFSAGRSNRDYRTLIDAVGKLGVATRIACDVESAVSGDGLPSNVEVLRDCFDAAYMDQLRNASIVVVPLATDDVSAGQMVLLHAMALGRPIIVTDTDTTREYVEDGVSGILVPGGDAPALTAAIERLLADRDTAEEIGRNAYRAFDDRFSVQAHARQLHEAVIA